MFSTKLDKALLEQLERAARDLKIPQRRLVEEALRARLDGLHKARALKVLKQTRGTWKRQDRPEATVRAARKAFRTKLIRLGELH
jgi:hypothetical protein